LHSTSSSAMRRLRASSSAASSSALATRLATSSRTPSAKVTATPRSTFPLMDSARADAEFRERFGTVLRTRWAPSLLTADKIAVNEALRDFYVLADQLNGQLRAHAGSEGAAIGFILRGRGRPLDGQDIAGLDEALTQNAAAQAVVRELAGKLHTDERSWIRPLVVGLFLGVRWALELG